MTDILCSFFECEFNDDNNFCKKAGISISRKQACEDAKYKEGY